MKVLSIMINSYGESTETKALIKVSGLGDVMIEDCFPDEAVEMMKTQAIKALRFKLKMPFVEPEKKADA